MTQFIGNPNDQFSYCEKIRVDAKQNSGICLQYETSELIEFEYFLEELKSYLNYISDNYIIKNNALVFENDTITVYHPK